jgi:hypothetical protein
MGKDQTSLSEIIDSYMRHAKEAQDSYLDMIDQLDQLYHVTRWLKVHYAMEGATAMDKTKHQDKETQLLAMAKIIQRSEMVGELREAVHVAFNILTDNIQLAATFHEDLQEYVASHYNCEHTAVSLRIYEESQAEHLREYELNRAKERMEELLGAEPCERQTGEAKPETTDE